MAATTDVMMINTCIVCRSTSGLQTCGTCKVAKYCSRECQQRDWDHHKLVCIAGNAYKEKLEDIKFMLSVETFLDFLHALALSQNVFTTGRLVCKVEDYGPTDSLPHAGRPVCLTVLLPADPETGSFHVDMVITLTGKTTAAAQPSTAAYSVGIQLDHDRATHVHTGRTAEIIAGLTKGGPTMVRIVVQRDGTVTVDGTAL